MAGTADDIARFFDREACCAPLASDDDALSRVSAALLTKLEELGLTELSVLDVGCGMGGLSVALAESGARTVTGLDLSPESIAVASRRRPAGLADRIAFAVGDGATATLQPHDAVVLNKVVCCYFDPAALLDNAAAAARRFVVISMPASRGLRGVVARGTLGVENTWHRLRRRPFRAWIHDTAALGRQVRELGFEHISVQHLGVWRLEVYAATR